MSFDRLKKKELLEEIEKLQRELESLKHEKSDLDVILETTTNHADIIESQLLDTTRQLGQEVKEREQAEAALQLILEVLEQEKQDLEMLLHTATEHGDVIERALHTDSMATLRQNQEMFRQISEATPLGIFVVKHSDQKIFHANQTATKGLQVSKEQLLHQDFHLLFADWVQLPPPNHAMVIEEREMRRGDGTQFWAQVSFCSLDLLSQSACIVTFVDISDRKEQETLLHQMVCLKTQELQWAKDASEAANRAKSEFLAQMSHEIRTPLNAVLGFAQLMALDQTLTPTQHENVSIIHTSGQHLLKLINDILELSKIESGQVTLHSRSFDLWHTLETLQEMFRLQAEAKGLRLCWDIAPETPKVILSDPEKLSQVLINLIGNALKFTERGFVTLRVRSEVVSAESVMLHFVVEDTGPGIPEEEQQKIFDSFTQSTIGQKALEGSGLGLAIAQKIVRLWGGEITLDSAVDRGSSFAFGIKVALSSELTPPPAAAARAQVIHLIPSDTDYRILVIDDDPTHRQYLMRLLSQIGFMVREAESAPIGLQLWKEWNPHLIFTDWKMPGMNGLELVEAIRQQDQTLPVLLLTATAYATDSHEVLFSGCTDYLLKPLEQNLLLDKIAQYLPIRYSYRPLSPALPKEQVRLLLAEDNPVNQMVSLKMLTKLGYNVDVVSNGAEALAAIRSHGYNLVLVDVEMPVLDGVSLARRVLEEIPQPPLMVAMTAHDIEARERCLQAGMVDFITKPLQLDALRLTLQRYVGT